MSFGFAEFFDPLTIVRHEIKRWDDETRSYVCECGHYSTSATDHEIHALKAQRGES